jgi:succinyl-diaminopimelate desuccinylase
MDPKELSRFVEKYHLARDAALQSAPERGTSGLEAEWNIIDENFSPLQRIRTAQGEQSFIEILFERFMPDWLKPYHDLEVYDWITEWGTEPYYHPAGAVYEVRALEGCLLNALNACSLTLGRRLNAWHGNLLWPIEVGYENIPDAWELSKRRYLERCVDMFGFALSTAGVHANVSLPESLISLDFLHRPTDAEDGTLVNYRTDVYIRAARVLRAFASLFIATTASTPLRGELRDDRPVIRLTDYASNRLTQFPNPPELDVPHLYRSAADYVRISSDLVRRQIRFGNNNWTPSRARSDPAAVAHIIHLTTDELHAAYQKDIYGGAGPATVEEVARRIETENMLTRIELPMSRVELRTDEGGHPLELDIANLTFKQLLLMWTYANRSFGDAFAYEPHDLKHARDNEQAVARGGTNATITHPFTHKSVPVRAFLREALDTVLPLATALGWHHYLEPLEAIAGGAPNTAERLREALRKHVDDEGVVPVPAMLEQTEARRCQVARELETIIERTDDLGSEAEKLRKLLLNAAQTATEDPSAPVKFTAPTPAEIREVDRDTTADVLALAQQLIRIPSITNCADERLDEVQRAGRLVTGFLRDANVPVRFYDRGKYPALVAHFPGQLEAAVMLSGHFDVVPPSTEDGQFNPVIEGNYLWGRGAADMKTVVATYLVWMRDVMRAKPDRYPPINLMLIGNEENGETEPSGTLHVLDDLRTQFKYEPQLFIAGERTGEAGDELFGEICIQNRGVVRVEFIARGEQQHTGTGQAVKDLALQIIKAREAVTEILKERLTVADPAGWKTDYRFPFVNVGLPGVFNITADRGHLGLEIRPIPEDDVPGLLAALGAYAEQHGLEVRVTTKEPGVACDRDNPWLQELIGAVGDVAGEAPRIGRKKPGTSGRFAPRGQAVIWGQTGIGPHSAQERHYIPSIQGYYDCLNRFAERLIARNGG